MFSCQRLIFSRVKEIVCFHRNASVEVSYIELINCSGANLAVLFNCPFPISLCTTGPHQRKNNVSRVLGFGHCSPFWLLPASISTSRSLFLGYLALSSILKTPRNWGMLATFYVCYLLHTSSKAAGHLLWVKSLSRGSEIALVHYLMRLVTSQIGV